MSLTDFLFQGAAPVPAPTGSDTSNAVPAWLNADIYNLGGAAMNVASQPYQPFPGPQNFTPSDQTKQAWQTAGSNVGSWNPMVTQAGALTTAAGTPINSSDINNYLNPYTQDVTGALARLAGQNLGENLLPQISDTFTRSGQSGSPQQSEFDSRALRDTQASLLNAQSSALQQGYQGALSAAQQQKQLEQSTGAQSGQLGALTSQLGAGDVAQLAGAGSAQDTIAQNNINSAKANFTSQQQWPYQNIGFVSNVLRGLPINTSSQTVGTTYPQSYGSSPLSTGIGIAAAGSALGLAKGGPVRGYATGGASASSNYQQAIADAAAALQGAGSAAPAGYLPNVAAAAENFVNGGGASGSGGGAPLPAPTPYNPPLNAYTGDWATYGQNPEFMFFGQPMGALSTGAQQAAPAAPTAAPMSDAVINELGANAPLYANGTLTAPFGPADQPNWGPNSGGGYADGGVVHHLRRRPAPGALSHLRKAA